MTVNGRFYCNLNFDVECRSKISYSSVLDSKQNTWIQDAINNSLQAITEII